MGYDIISKPSNLDVFGRTQVATPYSIVEWTGYKPDQIGAGEIFGEFTETGGTVTHNATSKSYEINTTATSGSTACMRTNKWYRYQPGRAQLLLCTFDAAPTDTNLTQQIGLFDSDDGVFFEIAGTDLNMVIRTSVSGSVVNNAVARANWNGDKLDGTGSSGITLDLTKSQLLCIMHAFLGVGEVRYGFLIDGDFHLCHSVKNSNNTAQKYMRSGTLPFSAIINNTAATSGTNKFQLHCFNIESLGGGDYKEPQGTLESKTVTEATVTTTQEAVLAIRPKLNYNSETNRSIAIITGIRFMTSGDEVKAYIRIGGSVTGGSWNSGSGEAFETNTTMSNYSGTHTVLTPLLNNNQSVSLSEKDLASFTLTNDAFATAAGDGDIVVITMKSLGTTTSVDVSLEWKEIYR